ncbi:MAG TPA: penicillin-binding transpeptidase domain-containing protein [Bryobacteraceae bacterium]|jgi:cell division protein FtsI/penicillin-binding protein 2|nr:penicillin-binding transpeptidase domain-containing protein [Bryobacteraceae bacterium]
MKRLLLPSVAGFLMIAAPFAGAQARRTSLAHKASPGRPAVRRAPPPVDPTEGDNVDGEDLEVRRAAVAALGDIRGSVVVADPNTGRILTMVNQKLGLQAGFIPCSTIKLVTSLAALNEHVVAPDAQIHIGRYTSFNLTNAIAHSNNEYFGVLGTRLGFARVTHYAELLGLGEKAGWEIPGEQPGTVAAAPPKAGGMGLMTAYGEGFQVTPLELTALVSSIANGGTLYYLQYPRSDDDVFHFTPRVKRALELDPQSFADLKVGMRGAVEYGTATRAAYASDEAVLGKTGTCTDFNSATHMGWFGSFNDVGNHQLVVVVMLTAVNKTVSGGAASAVAGAIYKSLAEQRYFTADGGDKRPSPFQILVSTPTADIRKR